MDTTNLAPNLGLLNVQANVLVGGISPGCNFDLPNDPPGCGVFPGDKGIAIGQVIDPAGISVSSDPSAHTVSVSGGVIRNNPTSTTTLNGLFPNASSDPTKAFADGDKFGIPTLNVNTR